MAYKRDIKSAADEFTYKGSIVVRNPNFAPFTSWRNALWVHMIPLKLESQSSAGRGGSISIGGSNRPTFAFLAPDNIQENINHTWEGFDSIQSRLMGKLVGAAKLKEEWTALKDSMPALVKGEGGGGTPTKNPVGLHAAAVRLAGKIAGTSAPKFKVDTPLRYMDSTRREITLDFNLMSSGPILNEWAVSESQVKRSVTDIVKDLMMYSAPAIKNTSSIEYEFPYIWRLETYPNSFLLYEFCALSSVQPTWRAPYIDGYPTNCTVTLTFKDLSPLFRSTIKSGSAIHVIDNTDVSQMTDSQLAATFEDIKPPINKKDTIKSLLDARTKFKRMQALYKSRKNDKTILRYFQGQGMDKAREFLDSGAQQSIANKIPIGKNTPNLIAKIPRV